MSIGKLTAAAFVGNLENTAALANLKFDFSLVKIEAPAEYRDLGLSLSSGRSKDAETGISHVTARKLGALFEDLLPKTPNLFRAYGTRASKISSDPKLNPKGGRQDGIFADHIGADGTTIWAAATSGDAAIGAHLLACMLARIWSPPEAISIWSELIAERKKALSRVNGDDPLNASAIVASMISLERDQIARWDAGARAWLLTADEAHKRNQKQLLLIVNNLGIPVNMESGVYGSVIDAWQTAMVTIERILSGEGQSVQIGAPLLALASWHLYPDMLVLGKVTKMIRQNDPLVPSNGVVTFGLQNKEAGEKGIYWSLPLAHLRYYGDPEMSERKLSSYSSRVSIDQLLRVALGSFISLWASYDTDLQEAIETLLHMSRLMENYQNSGAAQLIENWSKNWLHWLGVAAQGCIKANEKNQQDILKLSRFGRRRYSTFLSPKNMTPFFGLQNATTFLKVLRGTEERINAMSQIAKGLQTKGTKMVIQYKVDEHWECIVASPREDKATSGKRKRDSGSCGSATLQGVRIHWLPLTLKDGSVGIASDLSKKLDKDLQRRVAALKKTEEVRFIDITKYPEFQRKFKQYDSEVPMPILNDLGFSPGPEDRPMKFVYITGDGEDMALFSIGHEEGTTSTRTRNLRGSSRDISVSLKMVRESFKKAWVSPEQFEDHLLTGCDAWTNSPLDLSLAALSTAAELYQSLPQATIPLEVAERPIYEANWIPTQNRANLWHRKGSEMAFDNFSLTLAEEFACIVYFESGGFNIQASSLTKVMAMSSGNSLYIPKWLLEDPWDNNSGPGICRVNGNLGRSGIAMMVPPKNPRVRPLRNDCWELINHRPFDGKASDCFQHTTLHLSFTEYILPIDIGEHGARDTQVYFLEAPVSVHDRGEWVGDIDALSSLTSNMHRRVTTCQDGHAQNPQDLELLSQFVSIENWEEFLDSPMETCVMKTHQNWQARLATIALSVQRGHETRTLPANVCWPCFLKQLGTKKKTTTADRDVELSSISAVIEEDGEEDMQYMEIDVDAESNRSDSENLTEVEDEGTTFDADRSPRDDISVETDDNSSHWRSMSRKMTGGKSIPTQDSQRATGKSIVYIM